MFGIEASESSETTDFDTLPQHRGRSQLVSALQREIVEWVGVIVRSDLGWVALYRLCQHIHNCSIGIIFW